MSKHIQIEERERFERAKHVAKLVEEFKIFCMDSIMEGHSDEMDDHFDYLEVALEAFIDLKSDEDKE